MNDKFCPSCGQKIVDGGEFCTNCGYKLSEQNNNVNNNVNVPVNNQSIPDQNVQNTQQNNNGFAIAGFVLGLLCLTCCCAPITSLPGLICSILGLNYAKNNGEVGKGFAIAGIVLSSIALVSLLIWLVIWLVNIFSYGYYY